MKTHFIEATNSRDGEDGSFNWGKFLLCQFDENEWNYQSVISFSAELTADLYGGNRKPLLREIGFNQHQFWLYDLQTCEGAAFLPGGCYKEDLHKHQIWVCLLYEPLLKWLYEQDLTDITKLPSHVNLPDADSGLAGYRREGPNDKERKQQAPKSTYHQDAL